MSQFIPIEEMSLDGYQIVNAGLSHHPARKCEATCTVWPSRISFNKLALEKLHYCDYIKIQVNPTTKCLLVCPVTSSDKDGIRWIKGEKEKFLRNLESKAFGEQLYQKWNLDPDYTYRSVGHLVTVNQKVMILFDFSHPEVWKTCKSEGTA